MEDEEMLLEVGVVKKTTLFSGSNVATVIGFIERPEGINGGGTEGGPVSLSKFG